MQLQRCYCFVIAFLRHQQGLVYSTGLSRVNRGKAAWRRWRRAQWKKITLLVTLHQTRIQKQNPKRFGAEKGARNSIVWLWFGFKKSDTDQTMVICKKCCQQVVTSDLNISNLFYHLKTRNEKQYRDSGIYIIFGL